MTGAVFCGYGSNEHRCTPLLKGGLSLARGVAGKGAVGPSSVPVRL